MARKRKRKKSGKQTAAARERFPRADYLEQAEDELVRATSDRKAARALAQATGLSFRHASRYVEAALVLLKKDADPDPKRRAERRAILRAQSEHIYKLCVTRG